MRILPRLVLNYKGWYMIVKLKTKKKRLTSTDFIPRTGKNSVFGLSKQFFSNSKSSRLKSSQWKPFPKLRSKADFLSLKFYLALFSGSFLSISFNNQLEKILTKRKFNYDSWILKYFDKNNEIGQHCNPRTCKTCKQIGSFWHFALKL